MRVVLGFGFWFYCHRFVVGAGLVDGLTLNSMGMFGVPCNLTLRVPFCDGF